MEKQNLAIEQLNGKRELLAPKLPLKQPFSISVTTANVCNLKCEFCAISDLTHKKNKAFLDFDTLRLAVNSIQAANWHLKQMVLVGLGEPFLNKDIAKFVKYIKDANIVDKVHIVTNGTLLTKQLSDELISAGLDVLRISINGISKEDYKKYTSVDINFEKMIENLTYFYEHKPDSLKVYVKIMDYIIDTPEKKKKFEDTFNPICDVINIEFLTEMSTSIDYSNISNLNKDKGLKGFSAAKTEICPLPFYHAYLNAEGTISACCVAGPWYTPPAIELGDLHTQSIEDIWINNYKTFLTTMLKEGKNNAHPICKKCKAYMSYIYPEDVIDYDAERIAADIEKGIYR